MAYLIDSNIFIRSKNEMPMNLWPTFWQRMTDMVNSGELFISTKVKEEIERGNDELTEWLKTLHQRRALSGLMATSCVCMERSRHGLVQSHSLRLPEMCLLLLPMPIW